MIKRIFILFTILGALVLLLSSCAKRPIGQQELHVSPSATDTNLNANNGIVGGYIPTEEEGPRRATVGLLDLDRGAICTGTIIGQRLVLTAAHCVTDARKLVIFFGPSLEAFQPATIATQIIISNQYNKEVKPKVDRSDVALIQLKTNIPETHQIAKVAPSHFRPPQDAPITIVGYGVTSGIEKEGSGILRTASVTIRQSKFGTTEFVTDQSNGTGVCFGDSGGPAYLFNHGELTLIGVASRVGNDPDQDPCKGVGVYSNVSSFRPFIINALKALITE